MFFLMFLVCLPSGNDYEFAIEDGSLTIGLPIQVIFHSYWVYVYIYYGYMGHLWTLAYELGKSAIIGESSMSMRDTWTRRTGHSLY